MTITYCVPSSIIVSSVIFSFVFISLVMSFSFHFPRLNQIHIRMGVMMKLRGKESPYNFLVFLTFLETGDLFIHVFKTDKYIKIISVSLKRGRDG